MKIKRNLSTPEGRAWWESIEKDAAEVDTWLAWKRAGINVSDVRSTPRTASEESDTMSATYTIVTGDTERERGIRYAWEAARRELAQAMDADPGCEWKQLLAHVAQLAARYSEDEG